MADNPFDQTNIGVRERPVSSDHNQMQSQLYRTVRELERYRLAGRTTTANAQALSATRFVGAGLRATPTGAMSVSINDGHGWIYDPLDVATSIGATDLESVDDRSAFKPLFLVSPTTFAVPAAPSSPNSRIDIIEARNPRRLENGTTRKQLDGTSLSFNDHTFFKTLAYALDGQAGIVTSPSASTAALSYKIGVAGNPGLAPTTTAGYTKIAEIVVPNGTTLIGTGNIIDRRPLAGSGGLVNGSVRYRLQWNSGTPIVTLIAATAPPSIEFAVIPNPTISGAATLYVMGGEIQSASLMVTGTSLIGSTPAPVLVIQRVLSGVGSNIVRALTGADVSAGIQFPAGQKAAVADIWSLEITAASVIFGTANTNDMVINADLVLGY